MVGPKNGCQHWFSEGLLGNGVDTPPTRSAMCQLGGMMGQWATGMGGIQVGLSCGAVGGQGPWLAGCAKKGNSTPLQWSCLANEVDLPPPRSAMGQLDSMLGEWAAGVGGSQWCDLVDSWANGANWAVAKGTVEVAAFYGAKWLGILVSVVLVGPLTTPVMAGVQEPRLQRAQWCCSWRNGLNPVQIPVAKGTDALSALQAGKQPDVAAASWQVGV